MFVSILGKLSEIHLHAWFFSNPHGKVLIIVGISWSLDLRVQHMPKNCPLPYYRGQTQISTDLFTEAKHNSLLTCLHQAIHISSYLAAYILNVSTITTSGCVKFSLAGVNL